MPRGNIPSEPNTPKIHFTKDDHDRCHITPDYVFGYQSKRAKKVLTFFSCFPFVEITREDFMFHGDDDYFRFGNRWYLTKYVEYVLKKHKKLTFHLPLKIAPLVIESKRRRYCISPYMNGLSEIELFYSSFEGVFDKNLYDELTGCSCSKYEPITVKEATTK